MLRLKDYCEASEVLPLAAPFLPPAPVIVEAGAFNGSDSEKIARFWPKGRVHSFEPVPELYVNLRQRSLLYSNITPYPNALSDCSGPAIFYLSEHIDQPGQVWGCGSLLPPKDHLSYDHWVFFPKEITVETLTLDDWAKAHTIQSVDFLWLDMQGCELNMLKVSELAKNARAIFTEVEFAEAYESQALYPEVMMWMEEQGFEALACDFDEEKIVDYLETKERYYGNVLFVKRSAALR